MIKRTLAATLIVLTFAVSCDGDDEVVSPAATGPYVSVAVDNHFHDIHPENSVEIPAKRGLVIDNQGRNLHNFTVVGTEISKDVRPGRELRFEPIGDFLEPGTYDVICRYHDSVGMNGRFIVTE